MTHILICLFPATRVRRRPVFGGQAKIERFNRTYREEVLSKTHFSRRVEWVEVEDQAIVEAN